MTISSFGTERRNRRLGWRLLAAISGAVLIGTVMFANIAVVFAAGPAVNIDQCRNGGLVKSGTQTFIQCSGGGSGNSGWVNGNAGASNAHYAEGESISYRARITGLAVNDQVIDCTMTSASNSAAAVPKPASKASGKPRNRSHIGS